MSAPIWRRRRGTPTCAPCYRLRRATPEKPVPRTGKREGGMSMSRVHLAGMAAALIAAGLSTTALAQQAAASANRDHEGRRDRQRLHLPQRQSSVDVHRHQGRRDRDRSGRLRPADRRAGLHRRDQEGDGQADQVPDLQPPSFRPHRRRQAVQGCRRHHRRAPARQGASRAAQGPAYPAARPGGRQQRPDDQSRRHQARAEISTASTIPTRRW